MIRSFICSEEGQALTDYALILCLITLAVTVALWRLGDQLAIFYQKVVDNWPS